MNQVVHLNQIIQVQKNRAWGYATVVMVNEDGSIKKRDKTLTVQFPEETMDAAIPGSLWKVTGTERLNQFSANDFDVIEYCIEADSIKYLRPSGRILSRYISSNIKGVGGVIANRLVRLKDIDKIVKRRDRGALLAVPGMSEARIDQLIDAWPTASLHETMEWLEAQQLPLGLGDKLVSIFNEETIDTVKSNPFLLMAMGVSFKKTLLVAQSLGLTMLDEPVLAGIAQHVANLHCEQTKSTVIDTQSLLNKCFSVLQQVAPENTGDIAVKHGLLVKVEHGYQVYGTALMEASVAQCLMSAHKRAPGEGTLRAAWELNTTEQRVSEALCEYETTLKFELTREQRAAIIGSVMSTVSGISGGAGTGKTTILNAILGVYDIVSGKMPSYQMALAGRAARRMAESTGREAKSIAKFVYDNLKKNKPTLPIHLLIVIDEASMVDLLSMYKLVGILPQATRFLFVGDTSQLPPVGKGLIFHALENTPVPFFNLTQVQRQDEMSGIHRFATSVRDSKLELPSFTQQTLAESSDCSLEPNSQIERLIELWREAGGAKTSIILSPMRKGEIGVENINVQIQLAVGIERPELYYNDPQRGWIPWITRNDTTLLEGDPILVIANNYDTNANIRNGDLGVIKQVYDSPTNGSFGVLEINGELIQINQNVLDKLELGYAVTIHKSQGSEWPTAFVMLPSEAIHMIDQSLIYTAATRPSQRLVLMGDKTVVEQAIKVGATALNRRTCITKRMLYLVKDQSK
jgi:exodeoxyribonuclease V alpha subunit